MLVKRKASLTGDVKGDTETMSNINIPNLHCKTASKLKYGLWRYEVGFSGWFNSNGPEFYCKCKPAAIIM